MPPKCFDLTPTQKRLLVQLWASPAERSLFTEMSKQWVDALATRMVHHCPPDELLQLREAYSTIRQFLATVHNTAVAAGLPEVMGNDSQERREVRRFNIEREEDPWDAQQQEESPGATEGYRGE